MEEFLPNIIPAVVAFILLLTFCLIPYLLSRIPCKHVISVNVESDKLRYVKWSIGQVFLFPDKPNPSIRRHAYHKIELKKLKEHLTPENYKIVENHYNACSS